MPALLFFEGIAGIPAKGLWHGAKPRRPKPGVGRGLHICMKPDSNPPLGGFRK